MMKAGKPIGAVSQRKDGMYRKTSPGTWVKVKQGQEAPKKEGGKKELHDVNLRHDGATKSGDAEGLVYHRGHNPKSTAQGVRIQTGASDWDSHLFVMKDPKSTTVYGSERESVVFKPGTKILVEGAKGFNKVAGGRWKRGESLLDYSDRTAKNARKSGYDAVHFQRQTDVGTAIMNHDAVWRNVDVDNHPKNPKSANKGFKVIVEGEKSFRGLSHTSTEYLGHESARRMGKKIHDVKNSTETTPRRHFSKV